MQNNSNNISTEVSAPKYAGFGIRLLAYAIDNLIIGSVILIIKFIVFIMNTIAGSDFFTNQILFQYSWTDIIIYICRAFYFVLLTYFTSATLGKHILKLKVVSTNDTGKYTFIDILYRETIGRFLSKLIIYAGYFLIFVNKDKSSLHDMLSDTRVIYKNTKPEVNVNDSPNNNITYDYIQIDKISDEETEVNL